MKNIHLMMFLHTQRILSEKKKWPVSNPIRRDYSSIVPFFTVFIQARILFQSEYFYFFFRILFPSNMYLLTIFLRCRDKLRNGVFLAVFCSSD